MKIFKLQKEQLLNISLKDAWAYFSNAHNLAEITPPNLKLNVKTGADGNIFNGMIIQYSVCPLKGWQTSWLTEIKHVREPYYFVDEQRSGPYKLWYHEHSFEANGSNQVLVKDTVHYAVPGGVVSPIINNLIIEKELEKIFEFRREVLENKFN